MHWPYFDCAETLKGLALLQAHMNSSFPAQCLLQVSQTEVKGREGPTLALDEEARASAKALEGPQHRTSGDGNVELGSAVYACLLHDVFVCPDCIILPSRAWHKPYSCRLGRGQSA